MSMAQRYAGYLEREAYEVANDGKLYANELLAKQSAEIEKLRQFHHDQQELHEVNEALRQTNKILREQLAAVTKERDELKSCIDNDRELFDVPIYVKQLEAKLDECVTTIKEYARREECEGFYSSVAHKALAKLGADSTAPNAM